MTFPKIGEAQAKYTNKMNSISNRVLLFISIVIIFMGVSFRFIGRNWNQGTNLHPDEYGLTNTITQLSFPKSAGDYFNTRLSTISPYQKYDQEGQLITPGPDNAFRWGQWPVVIIRAIAEFTHQTGYNELRLLGRTISAIVDCLTLVCIFLIGWKLYGLKQGLLAAILYSLAVLPIQQSHFMTVDNFATFFAALAMLAAVMISRHPPARKTEDGHNRIDWRLLPWYLLFGVGFGMALASKINLLPLLGMLFVAVLISVVSTSIKERNQVQKSIFAAILLMFCAVLAAIICFRVCQPMSFRAAIGDTYFHTFRLNPDWVQNMRLASLDSSGAILSPPAEQWVDRPAIIFPLVNMILWGMGLPLGLAAWSGFVAATVQSLKKPGEWKKYLLPLVWIGGFFCFMATRWVKSIRYFLPIYPFLCLFAAWALIELLNRGRHVDQKVEKSSFRLHFHRVLNYIPILIVIAGSLVWAGAFVKSVYGQKNTRIEAAEWIYQNIPGPIHLQAVAPDGSKIGIPIAVPDSYALTQSDPYLVSFKPETDIKLSQVILPKLQNTSGVSTAIEIDISSDLDGKDTLDHSVILVPQSTNGQDMYLAGKFSHQSLEGGKTYFLTATTKSAMGLVIQRNVIGVEDWDEGLPMPMNGYDPYSQFYNGVTMQNRWPDSEDKRTMYLHNLEEVDYLILSSQRGLWSTCRLPLMYPMTIEYYRSLFDGRLGFDLVSQFQRPIAIGPLRISDIAGKGTWAKDPTLPTFNFSPLAAEEAFSVYDHAPVWIFERTERVTSDSIHVLLGEIDLSNVRTEPLNKVKVEPFE